MRFRVVGAWVLGWATVFVHACGGKVESDVQCEPGVLEECAGQGTVGPCYRQCLPSGDGYGACQCGVPPPVPVGGHGGGHPSGGTGGVPGGGGYPTGGSGGQPWDGGSAGGTGGVPSCPGCPSYKIGGLLDVPSCCPSGGGCGVSLSATTAPLIGLEPGCYPTQQPGTPDPTCPPLVQTNPLDGGSVVFAGCCNPKLGTCGVMIDLTNVSGPLLGCTDPSGGASPKPCGGPVDPCEQCVETKCAVELKTCISNPACVAIFDCLKGCIDQPCVDKCVAAQPAGKKAFFDLSACISAQCLPQCQ